MLQYTQCQNCLTQSTKDPTLSGQSIAAVKYMLAPLLFCRHENQAYETDRIQ